MTMMAVLLASTIPSISAQEDLHPAPTETIHLKVGDIFEILPVHDITDATYTWILTQDRTFLEANRAPSFRKRLIQPGMYTLYAEIASVDGNRRISRTITLDYSVRQPGEPVNEQPVANSGALVRTEPASDEKGRIIMPAGTQLVELLPVNPDIVPLALDLDLTRDADGDGKPDNDIQTDDTFFHSDATPLFLWITNDPLTTHSLSVTAAAPDGARTQKVEIINEDIAKTQGIVQSPVQIKTEQTGERSYVFSAVFENPDAAAGQLLYQWQFGDEQQSLVTKPEHTYAEDGPYTVSLLIRNLRDGSDVASTSIGLNVTPAVPSSIDSSSAASSEITTPTTTPSPSTGLSIGSIAFLAGLFLLSVLLGIGVIVLIGRLRGNKTSFADRLENMEKTIVKSPVDQTPHLTIAPPAAVTVKKMQEPPPSIAEREKEPTAIQTVAPAWLTATTPKSVPAPAALAPTPTPAIPQPVIPPAPVQKPATPTPPVPPIQTPKPAPAPSTPSKTPAWLQPARAGTDGQPATPNIPKPTPSSAPTPAPQQQKQSATPPAVAQSAMPTSSPVPAPAPVQMPKPIVPTSPTPQTPTPTPPVLPKLEAVSAPKPTSSPVQSPVTTSAVPAALTKPAFSTSIPPVVPFNPASIQKPKPIEPSPPPATPTPAPAPVMPAAVPVPVPSVPTPMPVTSPVVSPQSVTSDEKPTQVDVPPSGDQPIAIIRAESLNPQER